MKNNKKIKSTIIGTTLTVILLLIEVIMALFNARISYDNLFGKILFTLIVLSMAISIIYNIFAMFKVKDKDDKYYHLGLVMVSIILCILGIYKCM